MDTQRPGMFGPALIGGAFAGILTALPFINCLCCLWIIGGGMLAAYFLYKNSSVALTAGDGAIVGVFSGIIGAIIEFLVSSPLAPMTNAFFRDIMERVEQYTDEMPANWELLFERGSFEPSLPWTLMG